MSARDDLIATTKGSEAIVAVLGMFAEEELRVIGVDAGCSKLFVFSGRA
jgi:hypothetical protein